MTDITIPRALLEQAKHDLHAANLCSVNSMSSRQEARRLIDSAIGNIDLALAQPQQENTFNDGVLEGMLREREYWLKRAQPQQEPVGKVYRHGKSSNGTPWHGVHWFDEGVDVPDGTLLYTAPPRREWVGLTDVQWMNIVNKNHAWFGWKPEDVAHEVCKLTEAKLREKNTQPRQSEAIEHYEKALKAAFPSGAEDEVFEHWDAARKALGGSHDRS